MTVQVAANQVADCSTATVPRQQMFCRRRCSECDRRPVFECRQNAVVWLGHRWLWWWCYNLVKLHYM